MPESSAKEKFVSMLREAVSSAKLVKLTLGAPGGSDRSLRNLFVRPVELRSGRKLSFVYRHATCDITKNLDPAEAVERLAALLGVEFNTAHLFTADASAELDLTRPGHSRFTAGAAGPAQPPSAAHDRPKQRFIEAKGNAWLHALGVTTASGNVCAGMEAKFRQINKFVELLAHLLAESPLGQGAALRLVDMGCGKGYLTFAAADWLRHHGWPEAEARGIEARPELVALCNRVAKETGAGGLSFECGTIESCHPAAGAVEVLVALHACDTATDDAIAKGIEAGAALIVVAPCCHKELRPQLVPPPVLAGALRHGILHERQSEFVTDVLRAALLEWAGYETKVFEFISSAHTAKNLMIAAVKGRGEPDREGASRRVRELAAFYGIRRQQLARQLGLPLEAESSG